jgi:microcystin-dependent protein
MKILILLLHLVALSAAAQVGVNVLTPHPSSALHIEPPSGTFKGLLTPSVTTTNRMSMSTGTNSPADGLIVYDVNHKMHYYYHAYASKWFSMSPLVLSTPTTGSTSYPSGVITTPVSSVSTSYSIGINTMSPAHALDVIGNAGISGNLSLGGNIGVSGIFVPGFPANALVPAGAILMWSGSSIPSGWALCDGSNGTPDLRGRFIVSAGQANGTAGDINPNYAVNATGGQNQHVLTASEIPKHQHAMNGDNSSVSAAGGSHQHYATPSGQGLNASRGGGNAGGLASDGTATIYTSTETHSHPTSEFSGSTGDGSTAGLNNQPHENRPQYYVLKFIMKL